MHALSLRCVRVVGATGRRILDCVSFDADRGELVLVAGPSGAGKTTLLRVIASLSQLFSLSVEGSIRIHGYGVEEAVSRGLVAYVPQEPWNSLLTPYVYTELLFMGSKALGDARRLGLEGVLYESTVTLSAGEAQRLTLAVTMAAGAKVLLVDEVSAYLDKRSRIEAARMLREVAMDGRTVVVVDHDLGVWRGLVDRVVYLDNGRARVYEDVAETPLYGMVSKAVRRARDLRKTLEERGFSGPLCLSAENLWFRYPGSKDYLVRGLGFRARCGEVVAVSGPSGSGKTTLLKILAGAYRPSRGVVWVSKPVHYIPENPLLYLSEPIVGEEIGWDRRVADMFNLSHLLNTPIGLLSSGERRRLAIASALRRGCRVLLVDEPTVGLDYYNAVRVLEAVARAAMSGLLVVVATHSELLREMATRVVGVAG